MASSTNYLEFILEQLHGLNGITYKKMMGEYLLYLNGVLLGGINDDRLLIKKTKSNEEYHLTDELPYPGAKMMWLVDEVDNQEILITMMQNVYRDLKKES